MSAFKTKTLLNKITVTESFEQFVAEMIELSQSDLISVGFINQHGFNLAAEKKVVCESFMNLDILVRDGIGMKLAFKLFKMPAGLNLNGTDLIPYIIKSTFELDPEFYIFGTKSPWLENGSNTLTQGKHHLVLDGFQDTNTYIDFLKQHLDPKRFNVIVLAMGMPKQELLASLIKENITTRGLIICGGAIIDFQAGKFSRAPLWVRKLSLEWLYRLSKEPKRLFKRYVIGIPVFLFKLTLYK